MSHTNLLFPFLKLFYNPGWSRLDFTPITFLGLGLYYQPFIMRFTINQLVALLAFACLEQPAEAGFLGAAVRGAISAGRLGGQIGRVASLAANAVKNIRVIAGQGGRGIDAVRAAMKMSEAGQKKLDTWVIQPTVGGVVSGAVAGAVSGAVGKSGKKFRRTPARDRAELLSRQLIGGSSGSVGGDVGDAVGPPEVAEGFPQEEWDTCFWDVVAGGAQIQISGDADWVEVHGLPSACSRLNDAAAAIPDSGAAISCGDGCLRYEGLAPEDHDIMADYLNALITA